MGCRAITWASHQMQPQREKLCKRRQGMGRGTPGGGRALVPACAMLQDGAACSAWCGGSCRGALPAHVAAWSDSSVAFLLACCVTGGHPKGWQYAGPALVMGEL